MVQILTQANQYSVAPPVQKAPSVKRAATELLFNGLDILSDTVEDTADTVTIEQAQQAFDDQDKQVIAQAESIEQDKNRRVKQLDPSKSNLVLLKYNKKMSDLAAQNPRTAAQVRAIQTQELKTNPVLMAEMAIQKKTNDQIATMATEGIPLAIANGVPNPTRVDAINASLAESVDEIHLTRLERQTKISKAVADNAAERQQTDITNNLIPHQREANNAYNSFRKLSTADIEQGKKFLEEQGMDVSGIKNRQDYSFALRDTFIKYISDIKAGAIESSLGLSSISDISQANTQIKSLTDGLDTFIKNINNPDVLKNIEDTKKSMMGSQQIKILTDPDYLNLLALMGFEGTREAFGDMAGQLLQAKLNKALTNIIDTTVDQEQAQSLKHGILPSTANQFRRGTFAGKDIEGAKRAAISVSNIFKNEGKYNGLSKETQKAATDYVQKSLGNVNDNTSVEDKSILMETMGQNTYLKALQGNDPEIKKSVDFTMKYLKDNIIPNMKQKLEPLKTLSSSFVNVMSFISLVPVNVDSDTNPKKALNISVSKDGGIIWEIGNLTEDQEGNRSELEEVVTSLNKTSRWVKSSMNLLATTQDIKPAEAVRQYLYDNLGVVAELKKDKPKETGIRTIPYKAPQGN